MSDDPVLTERRDGVLLITLNRPQARNAVNSALAHGVAAALDQLDADDALKVGVLTGPGGSFCAGMDLKAFVAGESPHVEGRGFAGIAQRSSRKPLIAAIEGYALAGGLEVALSCDIIVAAGDARLGIPESKRGLIAAAGALIRLPRRIPYHVAMELALTGDPLGPRAPTAARRRGRVRRRPRQPAGRAGRRRRRRARARGRDRAQRPAGGGCVEAHRGLRAGLDRGGGLAGAGRARG